MNDENIEDRIRAKTNLTIAGSTEISQEVGGLTFRDMGQVMEFSKLMAVSGQAVPKHLRNQPGACLAVSLQSLNWRMDPFAVANKSYSVNDRIAYEAQLIQAVIEQRAPIRGRIKGAYEGDGPTRVCVLRVISAEDGDEIEYRSPEIGKIKVKNSPLWQTDPDQQLWYYSARALCRRHFPDVLLGVYEREEIAAEPKIRDVTPGHDRPRQNLAQRLAQPAGEPEAVSGEVLPPEDDEAAPEASHWTDEIPHDSAFPGSEAFTAGAKAFTAGKGYDANPHKDDEEAQVDWAGGWMQARRAAE